MSETKTESEVQNILSRLENDDYLNIKERTAKFKHSLIKDINAMADAFQNEIEKTLVYKHQNSSEKSKNRRRERDSEKVFIHRESLMTELFKISHIKTIRHIFISILIIILFQVVVNDLATKGNVDLDFDLFRWNFNGFSCTMFFVWLPMQLTALIFVYYAFFLWAILRNTIRDQLKDAYDYSFLALYVIFLMFFIIIPLQIVGTLPIACRLIILLEQVRLLMKTHAFIRHNVPRIMANSKSLSEDDGGDDTKYMMKLVCPKFSKYFYFMFAPTLVYRDEYPRTTQVRWKLVITHFFEVFGCILYTYILFDRFCVPLFRDIKLKDLDTKSYIYLISLCIMPGALIQLMTFFAFLHAWHNAWAEMLKFGDRQFYLDWWNSTSYNKYYRTWNTLVQDWLYSYIYLDLCKVFGSKYRALSQFAVILISSIFHEHILSFAFGFFYPIMFVLFAGFGFMCMFIPKGNNGSWNVFIWTTLFLGLGIQICLFSIEWYARNTNQCPRTIDSFMDYLVPRSILC